MSRITSKLAQLHAQQRKAVVPYIVAGDPQLAVTVPLMHALVEVGADIIELGVPFSDPMAEGPVIQLAHERALLHRTSLRNIFELVAEFRRSDNATPVVLMGYANPVEHMGYAVFADAAVAAGVDGLLTVDMPPEEADELNAHLKRVGIDNIFLLAPTTTDQRIRAIAELASGYLYCVSLKGVTGAGNLDVDAVSTMLQRIKAITDLPVTVGFGIKDAASAKSVARLTEGVVIGSALVDRVAQSAKQNKAGADLIASAAALIAEIRGAVDSI
ncbi:MAG: Tryptophan synthase alpha chain [Verrucomicrobiaceae bacterium]|nr:Tryptophan synthase alpha chain [Verrucomicrobiaceae bacterium]